MSPSAQPDGRLHFLNGTPITTADNWLSQVVPQITSSAAWQQDGALFITWDESSAGDGRVALVVVAPSLQGEITMPLDHYALLATIKDMLGVPRLGLAKQATSLSPQLHGGRPAGRRHDVEIGRL